MFLVWVLLGLSLHLHSLCSHRFAYMRLSSPATPPPFPAPLTNEGATAIGQK